MKLNEEVRRKLEEQEDNEDKEYLNSIDSTTPRGSEFVQSGARYLGRRDRET